MLGTICNGIRQDSMQRNSGDFHYNHSHGECLIPAYGLTQCSLVSSSLYYASLQSARRLLPRLPFHPGP